MRAFLAVDLNSQEALSRIEEAQRLLVQTGADLKPVEAGNLHFTMMFLGEIREYEAEEVWRLIEKLHFKPIHVTYRGLGVFPGLSRISVIWVGVEEEGGCSLCEVAAEVEDALKPLGFRSDKKFQPHMTIARVKSGRNKGALQEVVQRLSGEVFGVDVLDSLKLKKSVLKPDGPEYSDLYVLEFKEV